MDIDFSGAFLPAHHLQARNANDFVSPPLAINRETARQMKIRRAVLFHVQQSEEHTREMRILRIERLFIVDRIVQVD